MLSSGQWRQLTIGEAGAYVVSIGVGLESKKTWIFLIEFRALIRFFSKILAISKGKSSKICLLWGEGLEHRTPPLPLCTVLGGCHPTCKILHPAPLPNRKFLPRWKAKWNYWLNFAQNIQKYNFTIGNSWRKNRLYLCLWIKIELRPIHCSSARYSRRLEYTIDYTLEEVDWPSAFWQLYSVIYSPGIKLRTCKHYNHTIDEHVNITTTL